MFVSVFSSPFFFSRHLPRKPLAGAFHELQLFCWSSTVLLFPEQVVCLGVGGGGFEPISELCHHYGLSVWKDTTCLFVARFDPVFNNCIRDLLLHSEHRALWLPVLMLPWCVHLLLCNANLLLGQNFSFSFNMLKTLSPCSEWEIGSEPFRLVCSRRWMYLGAV